MMRRILAVLLLATVVALTAGPALADGSDPKIFYGDGFDNTTCADPPQCPAR